MVAADFHPAGGSLARNPHDNWRGGRQSRSHGRWPRRLLRRWPAGGHQGCDGYGYRLPSHAFSPRESGKFLLRPTLFAAWARGRRRPSNGSATFREDRSQVRIARAPAVLAAIRDLRCGALHIAGCANTATGPRCQFSPQTPSLRGGLRVADPWPRANVPPHRSGNLPLMASRSGHRNGPDRQSRASASQY
jgi:hypothetical protein